MSGSVDRRSSWLPTARQSVADPVKVVMGLPRVLSTLASLAVALAACAPAVPRAPAAPGFERL